MGREEIGLTGDSKLTRIVLLCVVLLAIGVGLNRIGLLQGVGSAAIFLLCPLMHVLMMLGIGAGCHRGGHAGHDANKKDSPAVASTTGNREASNEA